MRFDKGVGAMGVLALSVLLAVFLSVALPIIKSEASLKASDWLGFAGNIIAAVFAAAAAAVAWVAAQRQIRHAAVQNSVIAYGTLKETLAAMNADAVANASIRIALDTIKWSSREPMVQSASGELPESFDIVQNALGDLSRAMDALTAGTPNPWGNETTREVRSKLIQVLATYLALGHIQLALNIGATAEPAREYSASEFDAKSWGEVMKLSETLQMVLNDEMKRIYSLIDAHFSQFTKLTF